MRNRKGFTLLELMLVVIIIGFLVAMVLPRLTGRSEQARIQVAKADINSNIAMALKLCEMDIGHFPTTEQGLDTLLSKVSPVPGPSKWNGPYLERKPIDPWGRFYQYKCPGTHKDYVLYSLGADGIESADDITNWQD